MDPCTLVAAGDFELAFQLFGSLLHSRYTQTARSERTSPDRVQDLFWQPATTVCNGKKNLIAIGREMDMDMAGLAAGM
jgi:hypothetical protein